ncbi:MAG: hypothetical protein CR958_00110 [Rhodobacterales bacterium]|nr:MAG: hypothetical protein CR958_00110 [Rhodobacterales bacterium]
MFAPEGYIPLNELWTEAQKFKRLATETLRLKYGDEVVYLLAESKDDILYSWLRKFLKLEAFVFQIGAIPIRIDSNALAWEGFTLGSLLRNGIEPQDVPGFWEFRPHPHLNDFPDNINSAALYCRGNQPSFENATMESGFSSPPLVVSLEKGTIDVSFFRWALAETDNGEPVLYDWVKGHTALRFVEPFEGYAICTPERHFRENWAGYWEGVTEVVKRYERMKRRNIEGRNQSNVAHTIAAENQAYEDAVRKLRADPGRSLRQAELREIITPKVGERAWRRIVDRLRPEFPHISRPGRPPHNNPDT